MALLRDKGFDVLIVAGLVSLAATLETGVRLLITWLTSSALAPRGIPVALIATALVGVVLGLVLVAARALVQKAMPGFDLASASNRATRWGAIGAAVAGFLALLIGWLLDSAAVKYLGEALLFVAALLVLFRLWISVSGAIGRRIAVAAVLLLCLGLAVAAVNSAERFRLTRHYRPAEGSNLEHPNILLISVDTLRGDRLGAYGYRTAQTPNLDRLAAEGVLFERAYSHSSWTRPGFGSLMTSLYPSEHGAFVVNDPEQALEGYVSWDERIYNGPLRQEVTTLAESLDRAGYFNLALQSNWHASQFNDFDQGFDVFLFDELRRPSMWETSTLGKGWKLVLARLTGGAAKSVREDLMPSADLYRGWSQFVERGLTRPFFVWVNFLNVHDPYNQRDYRRVNDPLTAPVIATYEANDPEVDIDTLSKAYDSEVTWADAWVGRMIEDLDSRGLLETTLVVITADHGEELGDHNAPLPLAEGGSVHGRFHGHTLFREQVHVPWIMRLPGVVPEGRRVERPVPHLDFAPTLADYARARPGQEWRGRSLRDLIDGAFDRADLRPEIFAERPLYGTELKAITTNDAKAVWNTATGEWRFFDLVADPAETVPLNDPDRQAELLRRLTAFADEMGPLLPEGASQSELSAEEMERLRALGYVQ